MATQFDEKEAAKERIINASEQLFSEKGFDATRVDEIAETAGVNKALIYYYFKNKEDILDYLVQSLFKNMESIAMDFVHKGIVQMIHEGRLDIEADRWHFISEEAINCFLQDAQSYYGQIVDFMLEHRHVLRILMLESLKNGKHHDTLFHLLDYSKKSDENPFYKTIWEADRDFTYMDDIILFKFFYGFIPIISFAAYFDDYKKNSGLSDRELRDSFLRSNRNMYTMWVSGNDILLNNNPSL